VKWVKYLAQVAALAAVYFVVARYSLSFGSLEGNISAVWPPTGIAIAALALRGRHLWPGASLRQLNWRLPSPIKPCMTP